MKSSKQVVITGLGVVSPIGIGKKAFQEGLFKGLSGIKPVTFFDTAVYKTKIAGEITDFSPEAILGPKGLRTFDRSIKLVLAASKLCLEDAGMAINEDNSRDTGVAVGSVFGSIKSVSDFDRDALTEGARYVNPAHFPHTIINSPASEVSIRFKIKGFNATLSTGFSAGLDAVNYAADFIRFGRAKAALAGGVEELCEQLFIGFHETGCMASLEDGEGVQFCPLDRRRSGLLLGEGSAILELEDADAALKRGARIYCLLKGFCTTTDRQGGIKRSMLAALKRSQLKPDEVDLIMAGANASVVGDRSEALAIKEVFQGYASQVRVSALKSMLGEQYSNAGALQAAAAALVIEEQMIYPTINYQEKDPDCDLNIVTLAQHKSIENILINVIGPGRACSSMVIGRFER